MPTPPPPLPERARTHRGQVVAWSRDRGSSSLQMVVLMPALFAVMFLGVQAALLYQARTLCLAAAQEGARDAAAENGSAHLGIATASTFLSSSTSGVQNPIIGSTRSATTATVTVTVAATSLSVIPGWTPRITQSASLPVERITQQPPASSRR